MATNNTVNSSPAVPLSGATLTGDLTLSSDPTLALEASTKQYADANIGTVGLAIPQLSGNWYVSAGYYNYVNGGTSSPTIATGTLYFFPFYVIAATTYTDIAVVIVGTAAGNSVLGIYNDNGSMQPTGNPVTNSNSGNIANVLNTPSVYTFGTPVTLTKGIYWLACSFSASNAVRARASASNAPTGMGTTVTPASTTVVTSANLDGWTQAFSYSSTLPTVGSLTPLLHSSSQSILLELKVA